MAEEQQVKQRARYSTSWPAGAVRPAPPLPGRSRSHFGLSVNQWTALVCLGVVLFIVLALASGVVIGRFLHSPPMVGASTVVPAGPAGIVGGQPLTTRPSRRPDPKPESDVRDTSVAFLRDQLGAGDEAPGFRLQTLDGAWLSLHDLQGSAVVINFWATWCTWCKYELPALEAVYQKYRDDGLVVVGVDVEEPRPLVEAYVQRYGLTFPVILDVDGTTATAYQLYGLPTTFFVSRNGAILHVKGGAMREDELELAVRGALTPD